MLSFSVITPVFNREDCVDRCIESVLRQKHAEGVEVEHVIVDDGSSDGTAAVVEKYAKDYAGIRFVKLPQNRGTNAARNAAVAQAKGNFCILLDSDDVFTEDAIETISDTVRTHPECKEFAFACDDRQKYYETLPMVHDGQGVLTFKDFLLGKVTGDFVHVVPTNTMRAYPFDEYARTIEGVFFLRFYKENKNVLFVNHVVTLRDRTRNDSVTLAGMEINKQSLLKRKHAMDLLCQWFKNDYETFGAEKEWNQLLMQKMWYCIRLGEYAEASGLRRQLRLAACKIPLHMDVLRVFRLGRVYQSALGYLLRKKYHM